MSSAGASKLLLSIFGVLYLLVLGDCVSTYLCLTTPSPNHNISEANPVSAWTFSLIGLVPGLTLMAAGKAIGLVILYRLAMSKAHTYWLIAGGMSVALFITLYANLNNWYILYVITS